VTKILPRRKGAGRNERCTIPKKDKLFYDRLLGKPHTPSVSADGKVLVLSAFLLGPNFKGNSSTIIYRWNNTQFVQAQILRGYGVDRSYSQDDGEWVTISADASTIAISVVNVGDPARGHPRDRIGALYFYGLNPSTNEYEPQKGPLRGSDYVIPVYPFVIDGLHQPYLSADGSTLLIGGPGDQGASRYEWPGGAAWVFVRDKTTKEWKQQGPKLVHPNPDAVFAYALALSADGNTAFIVGDQSGAIFTRNLHGDWSVARVIYLPGENQYMTGFSANARYAFATTTPSNEDVWIHSVWVYDSTKNWTLTQGIYGVHYLGSLGSTDMSSSSSTLVLGGQSTITLFQDNDKGKFRQITQFVAASPSLKGLFPGRPVISLNGFTVISATDDGWPVLLKCPALNNLQ